MNPNHTGGSDFSLQRLSDYIAETIDQIGKVRQEAQEIQLGFNSAYVEWKAQHDAALERLAGAVTATLEEAWPDASNEAGNILYTRITARTAEERLAISERGRELRESLIPNTQTEADQTLQEGQRLQTRLRALNPRLDQREEELKAQRSVLEGELAELNEQIRRLSGCLSVVLNFPKINRLGRRRQEAVGELKVIQQELKRVREEWREAQVQTQGEQEALQTKWQELALRLARLHGELDYLDEEANREALALRRAVRYVMDHLKEPVSCPASELQGELDAMVELNRQTDDYQAGLGSAGSFMSLLDGIMEGLRRLNESVQGLVEEQRMHSSHLSALSISVPGEVLAFHRQWPVLARKVHDESRLCAHPAEFVAVVQPVMDEDLSESNIRAMFGGLGQALERATSEWRG
jgi:chromosome segregation ATPase